MDIREFLTDPAIQLPIIRDKDDFQSFITTTLDTYLMKLDKLSGPSEVVTEVQKQKARIVAFCDSAKQVIKSSFEGHPHDAYRHFIEAISHINEFVQKQAIKELEHGQLRFLYRVRRNLSPSLTREDLFHIPFEKRHLVSTQRYSIPGLPCLYLSGSIFTCWAEMGRPPFHELHAAAIWLRRGAKVNILNFSDRPARLLLYFNPDGSLRKPSDRVMNYPIIWPLIALCSIVVKHRDCPFRPEYIFPQVVLQWITKERHYDGIAYFSTNVEPVTNHPLPTSNIVFPVSQIKTSGRCAYLRDLFRMTTPHGWQLLKAVKAGEGYGPAPIPGYDFIFVDGRVENYSGSEFGNIEMKLNKLASEIDLKNQKEHPNLGQVLE